MLAEASQALAERDSHALRAYAGIALVTPQSGKRAVVLMRRGRNGRLRNANLSLGPRQRPARPRESAALPSHGRALREVPARLLAVLCARAPQRDPLHDQSRRHASHSAA